METYSITTDFGGVEPNVGQLHLEIEANVNITKTLYGVTPYGDTVNIEFDLTLSGAEKTELDNIVANHVPFSVTYTDKSHIITPNISETNKSSYRRVATTIFPGATYAKAESISYMESNGTSYDIQIFDKTHKQILLNANLTNTEEDIQDLGELSNLSSNPCQIEVSIKKNGGTKVYIESLTINYNS